MNAQPYRDRRGLLMERLGNGVALVRGHGAGEVNPNFLYLTGIAEPSAVLLLAPAGTRIGTGRAHPGPDYIRGRIAQQVLFLPPADPLAARWGEAGAANADSVSADAAGVDAVFPLGSLDAVLTSALAAAPRLWFVRGTFPTALGPRDDDSRFVADLRGRFLDLEVRDGTREVHEMRRLKSDGEVRAIERAVEVTAEALDALVAALRPGMREHEAEAEIARVYRAHGGTHAFEPIVGWGRHALELHYTANSGTIGPDGLLLVDTGASIDGYKADVTRTFPVGGTFHPRERQVYEAVLNALEQATALCRPGSTLGDIHARAFAVLDEAGFGAYLPHGIGHHLGLETHDAGDVHRPLDAGAVVTIEPGVYIPEEGIGIRIEDDVLVTPDGPRVLTEAIPRGVAAVERWVTERRR